MRRDFASVMWMPLRERFELQHTKEPMSGCWLWMGSESGGYGEISNNGKRIKAHRASLILDGQDPTGKVVMHKCDNRLCVNPHHLQIGTYLENMQDAVKKRRIAHGTRCKKAKLDEQKVLLIRTSNLSFSRLGRMYGVSSNSIRLIKLGKSWAHVGGKIGADKNIGSRHGQSKLNEKWVKEILASTEGLKALANRYNVCKQTIHNIRTKKIWKHIEQPQRSSRGAV